MNPYIYLLRGGGGGGGVVLPDTPPTSPLIWRVDIILTFMKEKKGNC